MSQGVTPGGRRRRPLRRPVQPIAPNDGRLPEEVAPFAGNLREQVFQAIATSPNGMTDREIQRTTGIKPQTQRPRRQELWQAGRIKVLRNAMSQPVYRDEGPRTRSVVYVVGAETTCPTCGSVYTKTRFA